MFQFPKGDFVFRKLKPRRPTVIRNGKTVKTCFYYKGTHSCLGPLCYWPKVGRCSIFNRINHNSLKLKTKIVAK